MEIYSWLLRGIYRKSYFLLSNQSSLYIRIPRKTDNNEKPRKTFQDLTTIFLLDTHFLFFIRICKRFDFWLNLLSLFWMGIYSPVSFCLFAAGWYFHVRCKIFINHSANCLKQNPCKVFVIRSRDFCHSSTRKIK